MPIPSDAERIENVVRTALDYIAEQGWVHALGYHARLERGAFIVSAQQGGETVGERFVGYLAERDVRPGVLAGSTLSAAGSQVGYEQPPEAALLEAQRRLDPQVWIAIGGMTAGAPLAVRTELGRFFRVPAPRRREEFELAPTRGTADAVGECCAGRNVSELAHAVTAFGPRNVVLVKITLQDRTSARVELRGQLRRRRGPERRPRVAPPPTPN